MKQNTMPKLFTIVAASFLFVPLLVGCQGCVGRYYVGPNGSTTGGSTVFGSSPAIAAKDPKANPDKKDADAEKKTEADPKDWTFWRGPEYIGVSRETGLIDKFDFVDEKAGKIKWKRDDLGGRSTPVTMRGKLYTIVRDKPATPEEGEKVVCVDMNTGKTVWENPFNIWSSDVPDTRVGWSSVVADPESGNVYALGVCDYFQCIDGETGETKWSNALHEQFGFLSTYGGRTNFPVICEDLVIINAVVIGWGDQAKPCHRFVAFDKLSGDVVWYSGTRLLPDDTTYSSPTVTVVNGQKAIVFGAGDGFIWALQARTGQPIWKYEFTRRGIDVSPLVIGDTVYCGHGQENVNGTLMGAVGAVNALAGEGDITEKGTLWKTEDILVSKSSPLYVDGKLFCFSDLGKVHIFDAKSGEQPYRRNAIPGTMMRASPLYADGKIYAFSTSGWIIGKPDDKTGLEIIDKGRLPQDEEVYASPIVSHGKLYIQSTEATYCFEDTDKKQGFEKRPDPPKESPSGEDEKPAFVQVIPAESLMRPGHIHPFFAKVYNSRGQLLDGEPKEVTFSLEGPKEVMDEADAYLTADNGTFLAPELGDRPLYEHLALTVKAKVGNLEGSARVRVVPKLPWKFDFEGLDEPLVTWVGARYRHVIRPVDGNNAMVKITTIPKGTRSRCWFGQSDLQDYTIQADVKGALTNEKLPDIGLIAQGYTLDLQGTYQKLEIQSWGPSDHRTKTSVDFPWVQDKWYRMRFRAANEEGKAVLQGKVWPRDEMEPTEWTITLTDSRPIEMGSPGLAGNAKDSELFLDNIVVVPNDSSVDDYVPPFQAANATGADGAAKKDDDKPAEVKPTEEKPAVKKSDDAEDKPAKDDKKTDETKPDAAKVDDTKKADPETKEDAATKSTSDNP